jgi:uncharacterized protein
VELWLKFLSVFDRTYTYRILTNFRDLFVELFPYLILGILIVVLLQRQLPRLHGLRALRSDSTLNILVATLLGMAAPLSVYVAVPVTASLIAAGMPAAVAVAFLFACPLIDPNLLLLTWGALGWKMAAARAVTAFLLGSGAGLLYRRFSGRLAFQPALNPGTDPGRHGHSSGGKSFLGALRSHGLFVARLFTVSLLIASAIKALVPPETVSSLLGGRGSLSVLTAIGLGIPFYQCGGASIPVMQSLTALGMSPGAVLAFFISGPATKIPALYAFRAGYGTRFLLAFLAYTLLGAFAAGLAFNAIQ